MALKLPTVDDLQRIAAALHFELTPAEAADYQLIIPQMFADLEAVDSKTEAHSCARFSARDPGRRPTRAEDPFNAIVRFCSVKPASSGKLSGKRVAVKDNTCIAGIPMTCGSRVLDGFVPDLDATVTTRLLEAGAEIVAITNMDNWAFAASGETSDYGATLNPHNVEHLAGGSSSGSAAALYYKDIDLAIGGDQGGSIRIPASWSGVVGLKPTHSLVPYTGIVGIDPTFDHAGPMARTVADVALLLEVIAGNDPLDPRQREVPVAPYREALGKDLKNLRVGILSEGFGQIGAEPDVDLAVKRSIKVLGELGASIEHVSVPAHRQAGGLLWALVTGGMTATVETNGLGYHSKGLYNLGLAAALEEFRQTRADHFPPQLKLTLLVGNYLRQNYSGRIYAKAQNQRRELTAAYDKALAQLDMLAMPTTPMKAVRHDPNRDRVGSLNVGWSNMGNTAPFDVTGHPAISVPCAKSNGLPIGLMLVGRHFDDATLLRAADAFERAVVWDKA